MSCPDDLLTIVILAGGRGSRMGGQDKGLLEWKGKPLIEHILQNITTVTHNVIINANRNTEVYQQYGHPVISDDIENYAGPLAGMLSALRSVDTPYVMTVPCDAPSMAPTMIEKFCDTHEKQQQMLYVAETDDGLQPVYAMINSSLTDNLAKYLAEGNRKTQGWLKENDAVVVHFDQQATSFFNINTEDEYRTLC
jgi:molybdenum cofactor guanylyltransferase